jgi:hypothetical protein
MWKVFTRPTCASDFFISNFHVLELFIPKKRYQSEKKIRLSCGVAGGAVGFWTKFEAQLAQPN